MTDDLSCMGLSADGYNAATDRDPIRVLADDLGSPDRDWMQRAACRGCGDVARFFPLDGESAALAVEVCNGCPVSTECLDYALRHRITDGVWGGTDGRTRKRMLRMRPTLPAA